MKKATTITINGRLYDAITGMPVTSPQQPVVHTANKTPNTQSVKQPPQAHLAPRTFSDIGPNRPGVQAAARKIPPAQPIATKPTQKPVERAAHPAATAMHTRPQKSQTLYRKALQKPQPTQQRSPLISKFGGQQLQPVPVATDQPRTEEPTPNVTPIHPSVLKALQKRNNTAKQPLAQLSGKELKEQLIKERLSEVSEAPKEKKPGFLARQPKIVSILTSTLALLILGGYLTYLHLPNISMRVAASRAGINANMPNYKPDGYGINGPITYSPGEVAINYKSNSNDQGFTLTQKASTWDSQAVLDNYVNKQTDAYLTLQEQGLTIYTFDNKAAWVSGGLLYTVEGSVGLSSEQVLKLATSL